MNFATKLSAFALCLGLALLAFVPGWRAVMAVTRFLMSFLRKEQGTGRRHGS